MNDKLKQYLNDNKSIIIKMLDTSYIIYDINAICVTSVYIIDNDNFEISVTTHKGLLPGHSIQKIPKEFKIHLRNLKLKRIND